MNKYTFGTILGTALLGLVKSKIGSGIRLKKKKLFKISFQVWVSFETNLKPNDSRELRYDVYPNIKNSLNGDVTPQFVEESLEGNEIGEVSIELDTFRFSENFNNILYSTKNGSIYIPFKVNCVTEEDDIDLIKDEIMWGIFGNESPLIKGLNDRSYGHLGDVSQVDFLDEEIIEYSIIVNADTGKEYHPPKITRLKLRKR